MEELKSKNTKKKFNIFKPWLTLDDWQKEYIAEEGNCFLLCGRQSGKTTAMSIKFGERAVKKKKSIIMMIALTEKQAYNLFFKTLMYLEAKHKKLILRGSSKPTKHQINLTNGSIIMCYAAGLTGDGLRTYTLTDLVVDEGAPMAREIFLATTPMLSVTGGVMDIASTPRGKEGYFYDCSKRDDFKKFYISAEDCPRHSKEHLEAEKKSLSSLKYAQEYLAIFLDELKRVFPDKLLIKCCTKKKETTTKGNYFIGVDIAGMGKDENAFEILKKLSDDNIIQIENIVEKNNLTTQTSKKIIELERKYNFKKIGIDDGGVGFGVFSELLDCGTTKRKTIALNNASRETNADGSKSKKLLKIEMYMNLLSMMEHGRIKLLDDENQIESFKSIQFEYRTKEGTESTLRIYGNNSHIVEGLIRAAWLLKKKTLKPYIMSI